MIHKIERLVSIGKFKNYTASGDVAFKKLTLFYGDNGSGKTTLTAILRSLTENKNEIIERRQSVNQTLQQAAQVVQRTTTGDINHTYNPNNGWSAVLSDIEIFDIHFVNDNIYSGFQFNEDHKKQLHQFVIGAQGISIQQQIEQNKIDKTTSRQLQATLEQQLIQQVGNNLTSDLITSFLSIPVSASSNIDQLITGAETVLTNAKANGVIQSLPLLSSINRIESGIDFTSLIADLQSSSEAIQETSIQELFANHCTDLSSNNLEDSENWLKKGFGYITKKNDSNPSSLNCPFCQQEVDESMEILKAYTLKFNLEFNALVARMEGHLESVRNFNIDLSIQNLNTTNQTNTQHITGWTPHLPSSTQSPVFTIVSDEALFRSELTALEQSIQLKLQNPSVPVPIINCSTFKASLDNIDSNITTYNQSVTSYNSVITSFRSNLKPVVDAQLEVDKLKRNKKRFESNVVSTCSQLTTERQNLRTLTTAYPILVQQQEAAATTFFNSYKTRINHYLGTVFKTLFRIEDVIHVPPRGSGTQSKIGYKLTIDGNDISFDLSQSNNAKDCLSEGDRSTIALAFFLSKLDIDPNLHNKTLVFDDPLSSFDSNRRMYTVQLVKDLFPRIKQVIVLSHNEYFLHDLSKGFAPNMKKTLRVSEDFLAKASRIEPLVLDTLVENEYFRHIKELENFLQNPDINKKEIVLGWLRNVLEAHLRFKFYRQLSGLQPNRQTFGNLITHLVDQSVVFRDDSNRSTIISKLNLINGISCRPHHGDPIPDYNTLGSDPNTMSVTELANFVTDTLNLVDNEL
jgi:wobble nucleotide-excising tRNase